MLRLRMRVCVLLLLLSFAAATAGAKAGQGENQYRRAADHYYSFIKNPQEKAFHSNWDKLIREFQAMAEAHPESHKADDAWFMVGKLSMDCHKLSGRRADLDAALDAFSVLMEKYPESTLADDAQYLRGEIYLKLGDTQAARKEYELVISKFRRGDMVRNAYTRVSEMDSGKHAAKHEPEQPEIKPAPVQSKSEDSPDNEVVIKQGPQEVKPKPASETPKPAEARPGAGRIHHLRYYSSPDYTRIVVDLDKGIESLCPHLLRPDPSLGTPPRLYFDFNGAVLGEELKSETIRKDTYYEVPISDGLLRRARAGQYKEDVVRVVLDIERIDRYHSFVLPMQGDASRMRFVMDVFGSPKRAVEQKAASAPARPKGTVTVSPPSKPPRPVPSARKAPVIVVDAGHGGKDPGAVGSRGTREKDIVLKISFRLKRELEREIPGAKVILTRSSDKYLTLVERTAKANVANADIFLSVHCNASPNRKAYGIETYYLDNTTDRAALKLAARENFVTEEIMKEEWDTTNFILSDLSTTNKVNESIPLAWNIQKSMVQDLSKRYSSISDHGVRKAPFWVLTGARMPCVLIETSFISNYTEEKRLASSSYQEALAKAIARGVKSYFKEYPPLPVAAD